MKIKAPFRFSRPIVPMKKMERIYGPVRAFKAMCGGHGYLTVAEILFLIFEPKPKTIILADFRRHS